jgi:hypothetical protein
MKSYIFILLNRAEKNIYINKVAIIFSGYLTMRNKSHIDILISIVLRNQGKHKVT